ncbi:MAG TPA: type I-U CRISPR-associated RAMP protein Csb1/Cas7u [Isosphaeraceae bacterium]
MQPEDLVQQLTGACRGGVAAVRIVTRLEPVGGDGDKIFPPTYEGGHYATERRRIDGQELVCVLLDSVASQANRMEQALLAAFERGECDIPVLTVSVARSGSLAGTLTRVTALDAPHRVTDAIFRDSQWKGKPFRDSPEGKRIVAARMENATALFEYCPMALIFGYWDSQAGGGVHSAKVARALVSEILGLNAVFGRRTSSRIDPLGIEKGVVIYKSDKETWTFDEKEATKDKKGKPVRTKPSEVNHGNVTPSISEDPEPRDFKFDDELKTESGRHRLNLEVRWPAAAKDRDVERPRSGGVTIAEARQTTVLSFPQLRRLRFPDPKRPKETSPERDVAGRTVLAALALYAVALQFNDQYQLRSRCQLTPIEPSRFEFIGATARDVEVVEIAKEAARAAFDLARARAKEVGLEWSGGWIELEPSAKLAELVRKSDEKLATEGVEIDAGDRS